MPHTQSHLHVSKQSLYTKNNRNIICDTEFKLKKKRQTPLFWHKNILKKSSLLLGQTNGFLLNDFKNIIWQSKTYYKKKYFAHHKKSMNKLVIVYIYI